MVGARSEASNARGAGIAARLFEVGLSLRRELGRAVLARQIEQASASPPQPDADRPLQP